jgi:ribonuclease HI
VREKRVNTKLRPSAANRPLFALLDRAQNWLANHTYPNPLLKWETEQWGENPADFGRK